LMNSLQRIAERSLELGDEALLQECAHLCLISESTE
jgi:hypothetical protein